MPQPRELRLGTRGSQLALWQAHTCRRADRGARRSRVAHRRHQDLRRSPAGRAAVGGRRQAAVRQGDRGRAPARRDRPRRAQQQGHAGRAPGRARDRRRAAARGSARRGVLPITAAQGQRTRRSATHDVDECPALAGPSRPWTNSSRSSAARRRSAPAASAASRSCSRLFPGARFTPIRGNLDTRLRKLDAGEHDALVLAAAGLRRLGFASRISFTLPVEGVRAGTGPGHRRDRDPRRRRASAAGRRGHRRRGRRRRRWPRSARSSRRSAAAARRRSARWRRR